MNVEVVLYEIFYILNWDILVFAICNNCPVRVICCAGKWLEIAVYKQEDDAAMRILVSAVIARPYRCSV